MSRSLSAFVVAATAATLLGGLAVEPARAASNPANLTLRLSDLPPGYLVGDDSGCGLGLADDRSPRILVRLERRYRPETCIMQFERLWAPMGEPPGPPLVESAAFEFRREAGAVEGFEAARALIAYTVGVRRESLEPRSAATPIGDSVAVFDTDDALVEGRARRPAVILLWRSRRVLSLVLVGGVAGAAGQERAHGLAQIQQGRIEAPTPLSPADNDDREVPLDNPQLGVPVYWFGPRLEPEGGLPALVLEDSFGPLGLHSGPGYRAEIDYSAGRRRAGVDIGLWRPRAFTRFRRTRLGRLVRTQRCARAERLDLPGGRAVIYGGYAAALKRCERRAPDHYLAHVFLDDVVVTINIPVCFLCVGRGSGRRDPYNTFAGMRAAIEAIQPRNAPP